MLTADGKTPREEANAQARMLGCSLGWLMLVTVGACLLLLTCCGPAPAAPLEPEPVACTPGERIDLPGGGWAWCDPPPPAP